MRKKIVIYSVLLSFLVITFGLGIYALIAATQYRSNNVNFVINDDQAFFAVEAKYYYGQDVILSNEPTSVYTARYTETDYLNGNTGTIAPWQIGHSEFKPSENISILKYSIKITNKNATHNLSIKLSNVAVNQYNYFITDIKYKNGNDKERTVFSNDSTNPVNTQYYNKATTPNKVDIPTEEVVNSEESLTVTITLVLNTKTKAFNMENNFKFEFDSISK